MKSKSFLYSMAAIVAMGLATSSCSEDLDSMSGVQSTVLSTRAEASEQFGLTTVNLLAGQHNDAGDVKIWNDYENVYVQVEMQNGWEMSHIHMFIGPKDVLLDPDNGYVNKNGSPKNGQFPINEDLDPAITESNDPWTYEISLKELYADFGVTAETAEDVCPVIALHAEVSKDGQSETAWGNGTNFVNKGDKKNGKSNSNNNGGGNWSMYIEDYCVEFPTEEPEQPGEGIDWEIVDATTTTITNQGEHHSMAFTGAGNQHFCYIILKDQNLPITADLVQGNDKTTVGTVTITEDPNNSDNILIDFSDMWFTEDSKVTTDEIGKLAIDPTKNFIIYGSDEDLAGKFENAGAVHKGNSKPASSTISVEKKDYYYIHVEAGKLAVKAEVAE